MATCAMTCFSQGSVGGAAGAGGDDVLEEFTSDIYSGQMIAKFQEFRQEELFCDFVLKVDHEEFKVHKAVLAGCSDYFRAMFSHGMIEADKNSLQLKTVDLEAMRPLLDFAYSGKLLLNMDIVQSLLSSATFLQITSAIDLCVKFLKSRMNFHNADRIESLGSSYGLLEIRNYHRRMILDHFMEYAQTDEFLEVCPKLLSSYLEDNSLRTPSEAKVLKCVLRWYQHNPEGRIGVMPELLERVRYTIDGWPAIEFAAMSEPFKSDKHCMEILDEAEEYMKYPTKKFLRQSYKTRVRYDRKTLVQIGGVKLFRDDSLLGFELPGDDVDVHNSQRKDGYQQWHYYHRDDEKWLPLGCIGNGDSRSHCPLVEVNDFAILVGGYFYTSDFMRSYQHCSNEVKLFVGGDFALWDMAYMHEPRTHHAAVHTPGYLYAIGGKNESGHLRSVERMDLEKEEWSFVECLDRPLFDHAATGHKDKVYVSGGTHGDQITNQLLCYQPSSEEGGKKGEWLLKTAMLATRSGHAMATLGEQLIVCGGRTKTSSSRCLASVESYSIELDQWTFLSPMRNDCAYMSPVVLEGKLLLVGGENSVKDLMTFVQEYTPETDRWGIFCHLPTGLKSAGCCAVTVKLSTGSDDTCSVRDNYDKHMFDDEGDWEDEVNDDTDEDADDIDEWRFFVQNADHFDQGGQPDC